MKTKKIVKRYDLCLDNSSDCQAAVDNKVAPIQ